MNPESSKYSPNYTKDLIKFAFMFILDYKKNPQIISLLLADYFFVNNGWYLLSKTNWST